MLYPRSCTILYCIILHCITLCIVLNHAVWYCLALSCAVLYCNVLHWITLPPGGSRAQSRRPSSSAPVAPAPPQTADPAPSSSPTLAQGQTTFCRRLPGPRPWPEQPFHWDSSWLPRDLDGSIIKVKLRVEKKPISFLAQVLAPRNRHSPQIHLGDPQAWANHYSQSVVHASKVNYLHSHRHLAQRANTFKKWF